MPPYPGNDLAVLLYENKQGTLFNGETVAAGTLSTAFQLRRERGAAYPWGFSVEVAFAGAPGTFELDVMGADTDNASNYISLGTIVAVNANNVGRFDSRTAWVKYVALSVKTLTTPTGLIALVTR